MKQVVIILLVGLSSCGYSEYQKQFQDMNEKFVDMQDQFKTLGEEFKKEKDSLRSVIRHLEQYQPVTFKEYYQRLQPLPVPVALSDSAKVDSIFFDLPPYLFSHLYEDLCRRKAWYSVPLDDNFPIIIVTDNGLEDSEGAVMYSFDSTGYKVDSLLVAYTYDGERSRFSINDEEDIRVAHIQDGEATILSYQFLDGEFIDMGRNEAMKEEDLPEF
ncbi:MAG: hypothetical protein RJQ09_07375 [Cyclobacteriaceae bacterium]